MSDGIMHMVFLAGAQDYMRCQSEIETKIIPIELGVDSKHK
jgi:hypothetical protein